MKNSLDLLIIKPGAQKRLYQGLSNSFSGLEPPLWAGLLASYIRKFGFKVDIVDGEIEPEKVIPAINKFNPKIIAITVSGTNPSASTMNMIGVRAILEEINRIKNKSFSTILIGLHPSALPERTLQEEAVDLVCKGEGFHTLHGLLLGVKYDSIKGLYYRNGKEIVFNEMPELTNPDELPMPAWDLLPMDKYRAHNWHCFGNLGQRSPYAVIYTSLGCPFNCSFCCINAIFGENKIRYRGPDKVLEEIDYLVGKFHVKNFKILDEMFDLNEEHVIEICDMIASRHYDLNIWAYARVDTINERKLKSMKKAGINFLGVGFESADKNVRSNVTKGRFSNDKIYQAVGMMRKFNINIGGNFIFGLPGETMESMQSTLALAKEINCEYANFYVALPYPGSRLFMETKKEFLPDSWNGYSQFGYDTQPLPTESLRPEDILQFRDNAFLEYYSSARYQDMILKKFGQETVEHVKEMLKIKLKRKILENGYPDN